MSVSERVMGVPGHRGGGLALHDYAQLFWRRKWLLAIFLLLGLGGGYLAVGFIPTVYRSSTLILVEPQKIPAAYVSPTVTGAVDDRLRTISQQIMSRTNLSKIIKDYGLYKPSPVAAQPEGIMGQWRKRVQQILVKYGLIDDAVPTLANPDDIPEGVVNRMRKDIDVKVIGKEAFSVAYQGTEPTAVMRVTNTLASLFIEENLKARERQAEGTSEFLESQLVEAERDLQKQERNLSEFQQQHRGALPSQLDTNLRTLDRLQKDISALDESIKSSEASLAEEQKVLAEERRALQELMNFSSPPPTSSVAQAAVVRTQPARADVLKQELLKLRATFSENYPDIVSLKKQLEELESANPPEPDKASSPDSPTSGTPTGLATPPTSTAAREAYNRTQGASLAGLPTGTAERARELNILRARREKIVAQIRQLEEHVNATPGNEEKLTLLARDHSISLKNYQSLLEKRLHAKISENLEKKQKSEQFRILDPAYLPLKPVRPNPPLIVGIGGAIGGGLGIGLLLLLNYFNPALRKPEDIYEMCGIHVLATIPRYDIKLGKDYDLVVMQDADSFVSEQYRLLYTKINDLSKEGAQKIFAITSALQNEGKTVTALNLAVVMAKDFGKKTLVLEGDFRRPSIPRYLKVELEEGLVDILSSKASIQATMVPVANTLVPFMDDNLTVLPVVHRTNNSSSLISSQRMRDLFEALREQYDFILLDAPPILPLSDMNIYEDVVDGILLVVRAENTPRGAVMKAIEVLGTDKIMGIVLNDVRQNISPYYGYNAKYSYKYVADSN